MNDDYRSTLASVCEHKRSYEPVIVDSLRNTFSPNNELKITQTAIAGDVFTNFNTSYLELELECNEFKENNVKMTTESVKYWPVTGQPACLVSRITGDYKFIDPSTGDEIACDLSNNELHIGLYRSIINLIYMPKSIHSQNAELTEFPYIGINGYGYDDGKVREVAIPENKRMFLNNIPFYNTDGNGNFVAKIRIPWNSLLDIGAQPYLVNVKSMNLTISWNKEDDFFEKEYSIEEKGEGDNTVIKTYTHGPIKIKTARTVTDYYRVNNLKNLPWGEEALIRPNIFPIGQNYQIKGDQLRWHQSFRIPYAPKACFLFFTDTDNHLDKLRPLNIDYFRCYTGSGFSSHLPQYDNIYLTGEHPDGKVLIGNIPDSRFFDELMYVANPAEEHIINYDTFTKYYRIYAVDFESSAELLANQNEIYFELKFKNKRFDNDNNPLNLNVHVVFIENAPDYNISVEPIA